MTTIKIFDELKLIEMIGIQEWLTCLHFADNIFKFIFIDENSA